LKLNLKAYLMPFTGKTAAAALLCLLMPFSVGGQEPVAGPSSAYAELAEWAYGQDQVLVNGLQYYNRNPSSLGHPYLMDGLVHQGSVSLRGKQYGGLWIKYDIHDQHVEVEYQTVNGAYNQVILVNDRINYFTLEKHYFERLNLVNFMTTLTFSFSCACLLLWHRKKYAIIHFHGASIPLLINLPVAKLLGKKVIAKIASAKLGTEAGALQGRYFGLGNLMIRILLRSDGFVATTKEIEEGLLADGFPARKIMRISNFIDSDSFSPPGQDQKSGLKEVTGFRESPIVIFSGRFIERKGISYLLHAWKTLQCDFPKARLVLLGDGPLLLGMKRLSRKLDIENSVQFEGHIPMVKNFLQASDIFVLPSLQEGMPNALLEAMACGLPPVATRIGGVEDIIIEGENGILVKPGDAADLAAGLRKFLADHDLLETIASKAQQTIRDHYTLESIVPRYLSLYKSLLTP